MLLDKFKSALLALICSAFILSLGSAFGLQYVAKAHRVTVSRAAGFAYEQPVRFWPTDMTAIAGLSIGLSLVVGAGIFVLLRNVQWTFRPRRTNSPEAIAAMLAKATTKDARIFAGKFDGQPMYVSSEDRGLVIGPPGTGKTAFLFNQVLRAMRTRQNFVAVDIKPELHKVLMPKLLEAGYRVLRVNPARPDPDADHWNPLDDIKEETDIAELCAALLPIRDAKEAPFVEAQRDWLKTAVFHVSSEPGGSLPAAFNLLSAHADPLKLLEILGRSSNPTAARLARRMAAGMSSGKDPLMIQGLSGALRGVDYLGLAGVQDSLGYSDFSIRELGKGEQPIALFLQFEESKINALGPLLAFMANGVITSLIETAGERKPVFLFLDELGNMPPIPNLPQKLNTIRSRQIPTWMYFQTAGQMETQYGRGAISTFFASSDFQMAFRLNDQATRELICKLIGTTQKNKFTESKSGVTKSRETVNVVEPHELGQLKVGEVIALYRGAAARGRATPYYKDFPELARK